MVAGGVFFVLSLGLNLLLPSGVQPSAPTMLPNDPAPKATPSAPACRCSPAPGAKVSTTSSAETMAAALLSNAPQNVIPPDMY